MLPFIGGAVSYACYMLFSGEGVQRVGALRLTGLAALALSAVARPPNREPETRNPN